MPAATITTSSAPAFVVRANKFAFSVKNTSDTTVNLRLGQAVSTSGNDMGIPLEPGELRTFSFSQKLISDLSVMGIHGGSGSKSVVYEEYSQPLQAVDGVNSVANVTLSAGDVQIGAVELKNASDDTRAVVGAGSGLSGGSNALAVGGQIGGFTANPSATFTRPADTTAYASGDLVANSTTAGSVVAMSFTVARVAAGSVCIRKARLQKSTTTTANAAFRLHLYTAAPTIANGDNAAWSTTRAGYLGSIDFASANALAFSNGAAINGLPVLGSEMSVKLASGSTIVGLLEARAAYAPGNAEVFEIELETFQD
jgi:hypothetical protein